MFMQTNLGSTSRKGLKPVSILNAPTKTAGILLAGLASMTAVWGFIAPIPIKITGLGILAPVDGLFTYRAPSAGRILLPFVKDRETGVVRFTVPKWSQAAYGFLEDGKGTSPDAILSLTRDVLGYMDELDTTRYSTSQFSGGTDTGGKYTVNLQKGEVIAIVDNPAARQNLRGTLINLTRATNNYERLIRLKQISLNQARSVHNAREKLVKPLEELQKKGYASKIELIGAEADIAAQQNNVTDQQASLEELELTIQKNQSELRSALSQYLRDCVVFSFDKGYVQSFITSQWDHVESGSELLTVSWSNVSEPSVVPVFLDQKAATEVAIGDDAILTPLGFSSAEVGGIKGKVESLEPIPYTTSTLAERLNSKGLAQIVSPAGSVYQVNVKLQRKDLEKLRKETSNVISPIESLMTFMRKDQPDTSGGYEWNNRSNPPISPREGFLLATQITTRTVTPIQMLIPVLKEYSGFDQPSKLLRLRLNQQ